MRDKDKEKDKAKKRGKAKKLTAAERRRIEREQRRQSSADDPLAAFDAEPARGDAPSSINDDIENFGGIPLYGKIDDYYSRTFGDFANELEKSDDSKRRERRELDREDHGRIKPASNITKEQRRRRVVTSYVSVFLGLFLLGLILSFTVMFRTTNIRVQGGKVPYSDEEIIETSGIDYGENIFLSKHKAAVKNLVEKYPYIEGAQIKLRIPGTQIIKIDAAIPSYQVQFSGGYAVVSANCRILEINPEQKNGIPLLKGIKLDHTSPGEYITFEKSSTKQILEEVVQNINENEVQNIYGIDISNTANIELNYDNRITILLGLPEDVGYKLRTAKAIISQSLNAGDKGTLDVSLCNTDRRSSYFTPIYSDTASQSASAQSAPDSDRKYIDDIIE